MYVCMYVACVVMTIDDVMAMSFWSDISNNGYHAHSFLWLHNIAAHLFKSAHKAVLMAKQYSPPGSITPCFCRSRDSFQSEDDDEEEEEEG